MATTPNYGWETPDDTDLVKDGALAMRTLGNAIDSTVFGLGQGLKLIKTQTIGTTVSTVTVTNAFSATYDNYLITISGGTGSTGLALNMQIGNATTGYYRKLIYASYSGTDITGAGVSNTSSFTNFGAAGTTGNETRVYLFNPFLTKNTNIMSNYSSIEFGSYSGYLANSNSYTDFTITTSTGTITGGIIRVYGFQNSI